MKYLKYICILVTISPWSYSTPIKEDVLLFLKEYVSANDPNNDLMPDEIENLREINIKYKKIKKLIGKNEVFYFINLSNSSDRSTTYYTNYISFVLHVPSIFLEYYDEYNEEERQLIEEFIWKHKQMGDLDIEHLRKVRLPPAIEYLEAQYAESGSNDYKIQQILDEIKEMSEEKPKEPEELPPNHWLWLVLAAVGVIALGLLLKRK